MSEEKDVQGQTEKEEKGGEEKKSKSTIILIVIGLIIILALIVVIILLLGKKEEPVVVREPVEQRPVIEGNILTEDNLGDMFAPDAGLVTPGYFEVSMTQEWHFARGNVASYDAVVDNVSGNSHDVYFDLFLGEDEDYSKVIYNSPVIARGASLKDIKLNQELPAGRYDCLMIYHLVDEEQNPVDSLNVIIPIVIEQ